MLKKSIFIAIALCIGLQSGIGYGMLRPRMLRPTKKFSDGVLLRHNNQPQPLAGNNLAELGNSEQEDAADLSVSWRDWLRTKTKSAKKEGSRLTAAAWQAVRGAPDRVFNRAAKDAYELNNDAILAPYLVLMPSVLAASLGETLANEIMQLLSPESVFGEYNGFNASSLAGTAMGVATGVVMSSILYSYYQGIGDKAAAIENIRKMLSENVLNNKVLYPTPNSQLNALLQKEVYLPGVEDKDAIYSEAAKPLIDEIYKASNSYSPDERETHQVIDRQISQLNYMLIAAQRKEPKKQLSLHDKISFLNDNWRPILTELIDKRQSNLLTVNNMLVALNSVVGRLEERKRVEEISQDVEKKVDQQVDESSYD